MRFVYIVLIFPLLFCLSSCGSSHRMKAESFSVLYEKGEYCKASEVYLGSDDYCKKDIKSSKIVPTDIDLLSELNGGSALFANQSFKESLYLFHQADIKIDTWQKQIGFSDVAETATDIFLNSSVLEYRPYIMDGVYTKAYEILGNLALGDKPSARVEVNRAYKKQQEASEVFRSEIKQISESSIAEKQKLSSKNRQNLKKTEQDIINTYYADLKHWRGYKNFMNPYVTYLSGLFFLTNPENASDFETAGTYMQRTLGMLPSNTIIAKDLKLAEEQANGKSPFNKNKYVWVIFENGMIATLEELKLNIPMFLFTREIDYISFALPKPKTGYSAYNNLSVGFQGQSPEKAELLADIDAIFIAEFNKKFPTILAKALSSTVAKTLAQYTFYQQTKHSDNFATAIGRLALGVYTAASTSADLRTWQSLPKDVWLARLDAPGVKDKNNRLVIFGSGKEIARIDVPKAKNSLVYIRMPSKETAPSVSVIDL